MIGENILIFVWEDYFLYLLDAKPPGAEQPFVPVQSDTAVQAKLHRDSWGHPRSGCSGPSCYWCPEGLGTEHDPPNSHPDIGYNALLHQQLTEASMVASVLFQLWLILHFPFFNMHDDVAANIDMHIKTFLYKPCSRYKSTLLFLEKSLNSIVKTQVINY